MSFKSPLIALCGYANSGKDEVIKTLVQEGFLRTAWADPVCKSIAYKYNLPYVRLQGLTSRDREWREQPHSSLNGKTPREALQHEGQSSRDFYPNTWTDLWKQTYFREQYNYRRIAVSGTRYLNEAEVIRSIGGNLWFVHRENLEIGNHYSEKGELPFLKEQADVIIHNTGSLKDLQAMVIALVQTLV